MDICETFGERIYLLRTSQGLTQNELGMVLGLERSTIAKYENNQYPQVSTLIHLAQYFQVSTDYLLGLPKGKTVNVDGVRDVDIITIKKFIKEIRRKNLK